MPNHQLLDSITHKDLRIISKQGKQFGDDASYTQIVLSEFRNIQAEYPIFFRKNAESGQFETIALFGFDQQENLFLEDSAWNASYIPLTIQRRPFLIGFKQSDKSSEPVVHVDMESPRVNQTEGESVFSADGAPTEFLQQKSAILNELHQGHQQTKLFIDVLLEKDLIEAVSLKIELHDGANIELSNLYTINEDKISSLNNDAVVEFHQKGYLQFIYMTFASVSNLSKLIAIKNQQ